MRFSRSEGAEFKRRGKKKKSVTASAAFVPLLAIWGALVAAAVVLVLPASMIEQIVDASALGALGGMARWFFAAIAAALGAAVLYFIGAQLRGRHAGDGAAMVNRAGRHVQPIDPASELGSDSLDAPIEEEPFADRLLDHDEADEVFETEDAPEAEWDEAAGSEDWDEGDWEESDWDDSAWVEPEPEPEPVPAPEPEAEPEETAEDSAEPLGDDFAEQAFQSRAARTVARAKDKKQQGGKVELLKAMSSHRARKAKQTRSFVDSATEPSIQPETGDDLDLAAFDTIEEGSSAGTAAASTKVLSQSAIDKLRSVPPSELSLVEMVERLAVALRNHHEAGRKQSSPEQSRERDAALAASLNELSNFTEEGYVDENSQAAGPVEIDDADTGDAENEDQLRDAFAKLQVLRGAA